MALSNLEMDALRDAGSKQLRAILKNGFADIETEDFIEKELYVREQSTFFDGTKHIPVWQLNMCHTLPRIGYKSPYNRRVESRDSEEGEAGRPKGNPPIVATYSHSWKRRSALSS